MLVCNRLNMYIVWNDEKFEYYRNGASPSTHKTHDLQIVIYHSISVATLYHIIIIHHDSNCIVRLICLESLTDDD